MAYKRDYTVDVYRAYINKLRTGAEVAFERVYVENLPLSLSPSAVPYVLVQNVRGKDNTDKNSYDRSISVDVVIVEHFSGNINPIQVERAASELMDMYNQDNQPVFTLFNCVTTTVSSNEQAIEYGSNGITVKRKVVFEHFIEQKVYDLPSGEFNSDFNSDFNI